MCEMKGKLINTIQKILLRNLTYSHIFYYLRLQICVYVYRYILYIIQKKIL